MLIKTKEQVEIIASAKAGSNLVIKAFAGAAKTSTCVMIAEEVCKPSLMVCFNKSIAEEAEGRFPPHVTCKTMHSLAWKAVVRHMGSGFAKKLKNGMSLEDINYPCLQQQEVDEFELKLQVRELVIAFMQSAYATIGTMLMEEEDKFKNYAMAAVVGAGIYWEELASENNAVGISHDVYLKIFQLQRKVLSYEVIYLDEAQDSSPVVLDIVKTQRHAQVIVVGDDWQSIYGWRGAVNALDSFGYKELYLTESFRFTQEIADIATNLINIGGNDRKIIGKATAKACNSRAVIVRTNAMILKELLNAARYGQKVNVLADLTDLWSKMYHIAALAAKEAPRYPNRELRVYKTYAQLLAASHYDKDLERLIKLTTQLCKGGLSNNINEIKTAIAGKGDKADYTLTTCHKAKGLEWDKVTLADDLWNPGEADTKGIIEKLQDNQTLQLLYVAVTRGKYEVELPTALTWMVEDWEYYTKEWKEHNAAKATINLEKENV